MEPVQAAGQVQAQRPLVETGFGAGQLHSGSTLQAERLALSARDL